MWASGPSAPPTMVSSEAELTGPLRCGSKPGTSSSLQNREQGPGAGTFPPGLHQGPSVRPVAGRPLAGDVLRGGEGPGAESSSSAPRGLLPSCPGCLTLQLRSLLLVTVTLPRQVELGQPPHATGGRDAAKKERVSAMGRCAPAPRLSHSGTSTENKVHQRTAVDGGARRPPRPEGSGRQSVRLIATPSEGTSTGGAGGGGGAGTAHRAPGSLGPSWLRW